MLILAWLLVTPAAAQVSIIDGDTLKLDGVTYRLWGIDAPETSQQCADGWPAGIEAKRTLTELIKAGPVACGERSRDRYGRAIGLCLAGGIDVQAAMVKSGMAWAFTRYSSDYIAEEKAAIAARAGVHAHPCEKAWEWRAKKRQ